MGANQVGVVSRHALVEGSMPSTAEEQAEGDVLAYCGRVPVKLRGPWSSGAIVVTTTLVPIREVQPCVTV